MKSCPEVRTFSRKSRPYFNLQDNTFEEGLDPLEIVRTIKRKLALGKFKGPDPLEKVRTTKSEFALGIFKESGPLINGLDLFSGSFSRPA